MKKPVSHYMIFEHLLEWIKATAVFKTITLLVYKSIMASLHNHVKLNQMKRVEHKQMYQSSSSPFLLFFLKYLYKSYVHFPNICKTKVLRSST